jgi:small subunit ribosomal protein S17
MTEENVNPEETENEASAEVEPGEPAGAAADEPEAEAEVAEEPPMDANAEEGVAETQPEEEAIDPAPEEQVAEAGVEEPSSAAGTEAPTAEADAEPPAETVAAPEPKKKKKRLPRALRPKRSGTKREKPAERKAITRLPKPEHVRGRRQERQGTVISAASDKTIVVRVDTVKAHQMYKKVIRRSTKLHAHDEANEAKIGDVVRIVETRPLSKMKRWRLQEIVEAAK